MYYVVTGAAGFIGSNLVRALNQRGIKNILAVDNLSRAEKVTNLASCDIADFLDKRDFLPRLLDGDFDDDITAILHQGACSDTMEQDGRYMMENNYRYSVELLEYCQQMEVPLIYASSASVYGSGSVFKVERAYEKPLNVYAYSKFLFDQHVQRLWEDRTAQIVGLRYFNVYGFGEAHKGRMASVVYHFVNQYQAEQRVKLFGASGEYAAGEQRRDFISVDDVVKTNLYFLDHPKISGIFNLGTGKATSYNEVAVATVNALRQAKGQASLSLAELQASGEIIYIPFPEALQGKYQNFTQADIEGLRQARYQEPFLEITEGVARYVSRLLSIR